MNLYKCFLAVVIVCIDNNKGLVYYVLAAEYCLTGAPWLCSAFGNGKAVREVVKLLKCIFNLAYFLYSVAYNRLEILLKVVSYNKYNLVEACLQGIMYGIIHNNFTIRSYRLQLLDTAAEA